MKKTFSLLFLLSLPAIAFTGCTEGVYNVLQSRRLDCNLLPRTQQQQCNDQAMTYEEFEEARKKSLDD